MHYGVLTLSTLYSLLELWDVVSHEVMGWLVRVLNTLLILPLYLPNKGLIDRLVRCHVPHDTVDAPLIHSIS